MYDGNIDLWGEIEGDILEEYKDSEKWQACLSAVIEKLSDVDKSAYDFALLMDFKDIIRSDNPPTGARLDLCCSFVNIERYIGESDEDLFIRFLDRTSNYTGGTPENAIEKASTLSGDSDPIYFDEAPAVYFVYTPGGIQLSRSQAKRLGALGTLGLPGAQIEDGNGDYLVDANGKRILGVALDATAGT